MVKMKALCLLVLLFAFAAVSQAGGEVDSKELNPFPRSVCNPTGRGPGANNPCQAGLREDLKKDAICHITPGAPGGYTCTCSLYQKATFGPNPSTCVLCPSAEPCIFKRDCPQGTSCDSFCGDQRGVRCAASVCDGNPCGPSSVCSPKYTAPYPYTCLCRDGFVFNYGTCVPSRLADVI